MTRLSRCLLTLLVVVSVQTARADCTYPPEIKVPDGNTATRDQMEAAQKTVKEYMAEVESYLACLDEEEKALGEAVTEEQKNLHTSRHNAAVDALNAVAARYNEEVQVFKKRQK